MLAGRGNSHKPTLPSPRCPLCYRTGHMAKGRREYVAIKSDLKPNDIQSNKGDNGGRHNDSTASQKPKPR